nr:mutarotase [Tamlana crocina]
MRTIAPNQYYYPDSDIHITVMSIISCYDGFDLSRIDLSKYVDIIKKSIAKTSEIKIQFKGLTASPLCIMVQGFMANESLTEIRDHLRFHFKNSDLQHSLDQRYAIQTAHATIVRFSNKIVNKTAFLSTVEAFKNCNFGTFKVDQLELVFNDWYQKEQHVKTLYRFNL